MRSVSLTRSSAGITHNQAFFAEVAPSMAKRDLVDHRSGGRAFDNVRPSYAKLFICRLPMISPLTCSMCRSLMLAPMPRSTSSKAVACWVQADIGNNEFRITSDQARQPGRKRPKKDRREQQAVAQ